MWTRLSTQQPAIVSPHASGSVRYAVPLLTGAGLFITYEFARADGSHDLRVLHRAVSLAGL